MHNLQHSNCVSLQDSGGSGKESKPHFQLAKTPNGNYKELRLRLSLHPVLLQRFTLTSESFILPGHWGDLGIRSELS